MNSYTDLSNLIIAFRHLTPELAVLMAADNESEGESIQEKLEQLRASHDSEGLRRLALEIVAAVDRYPSIKERLLSHTSAIAEFRKEIKQRLQSLGGEAGMDADAVTTATLLSAKPKIVEAPSVQDEHRTIRILADSRKGKTVKLSNLHFDFGLVSELASGAFATTAGMFEKPNMWAIAAGILALLHGIYKAATVELSEEEITTFCGLIRARNTQNMALESEIMRTANEQRERLALSPLTEQQILASMMKLENLKSVERVSSAPPEWRLVEDYEFTS